MKKTNNSQQIIKMTKTNYVMTKSRWWWRHPSLLLIFYTATAAATAAAAGLSENPSSPLTSIDYLAPSPLKMNMKTSRELTLRVTFNRDRIPATGADVITLKFETATLSPQFNILKLDAQSRQITIPRKQLESTRFVHEMRLKLINDYIGHAILYPTSVEFSASLDAKPPGGGGGSTSRVIKLLRDPLYRLDVTIVQHEGIWGTIFLVCVSVFMLISYINLGAQLDEENLKELIKQPRTLILGFLISVLVMPAIAWFIGAWFLQGQPLYRIGSFIFACGPAASASTLWTVMLNSDKELSVGLQVVSTVGAILTMPALLYLMDKSLSLNNEISHPITVPYARLMQTLLALLLALIIGWRFVGKNERAQKVSRQLFRPLVFSVLIFIIVFSSILYWYIYEMFDWNITLASFLITMFTYTISGMLGHCISCDMERAVAIAIGSAYKNSGIAFAVLLVAFDAPDTYIAYVPCLTQIVITSITLYLTYLCVSLYNCVRRRGQPGEITATTSDTEAGGVGESALKRKGRRGSNDSSRKNRSDSVAAAAAETKTKTKTHQADQTQKHLGDTEAGDTDEFIAMNVTDIEPNSLPSEHGNSHQDRYDDAPEQQLDVRVISHTAAGAAANHNDDQGDNENDNSRPLGTRV